MIDTDSHLSFLEIIDGQRHHSSLVKLHGGINAECDLTTYEMGNFMNASDALKIIRPLAEGNNPFTGEVYSSDSPMQQPDMVRALYKAAEVLENRVKIEERRARGPERSGKIWTEEEDDKLLRGYDTGMPIVAMAGRHKRTKWAIQRRLVSHGRLRIHFEKVENPGV
jgi:hypothetical protein